MTSNTKLRVVLDSNVWLSGLIFGGSHGKLLQLFIDGSILVIVSEELLSELRRTVIQKFPLYIPQLGLLEASILKDAIMVVLGTETIKISRDPDDDKFIETALAGKCSYIISGDKLDLRKSVVAFGQDSNEIKTVLSERGVAIATSKEEKLFLAVQDSSKELGDLRKSSEDLLTLKSYRGIRIVNPAQFLEIEKSNT